MKKDNPPCPSTFHDRGATPPTSCLPAPFRADESNPAVTYSRARGVLLGGAVGDALGAPVEFMSRNEILESFGPEGISEYVPAYGVLGAITDDTQMSLFTAEALLRAHLQQLSGDITSIESQLSESYLNWLVTQKGAAQNTHINSAPSGFLIGLPQLHHQRAPGRTCLHALREMKRFAAPAKNNSKGCGGVMRVAPVGMMRFDARTTFETGNQAAALTHGHPSGYLTGGTFALIIRCILSGQELPKCLEIARRHLRSEDGHEETLHAIDHAEELARSGLPHHEAIRRLGEGWVAEEALAISIYCAMVARDFREGIMLAVNHDGDSDSTGSMTGNLLGARWGVESIPIEWLKPLELRDEIAGMADDMVNAVSTWSSPDGEGTATGPDGTLCSAWDKYFGHWPMQGETPR